MINPNHRRLPLLVCLIAIAAYDLITATLVSSHETNIFSFVLAVCYAQTLISACWLVSGFGSLVVRLLVSSSILVAALMTLLLYFAHGSNLSVELIITGSRLNEYSWFAFLAAMFGSGALFHWCLCLIIFALARLSGWRLARGSRQEQQQQRDVQFGIRTIMIGTALVTIAIVSVRAIPQEGEWRLNPIHNSDILFSITISALLVPLEMLVVFGLLSGQRISIRLGAVSLGGLALSVLLMGILKRGISHADVAEIALLMAQLIAIVTLLTLTARFAGLRIRRFRRRVGPDSPSAAER